MLPQEPLEPYKFRRRLDAPTAAFDSTYDLVTGVTGHPVPVPSLVFEPAAGGVFVFGRPRTIVRIDLPEPCDRFTIYLLRTLTEGAAIPTPFVLEPRWGLSCIEESTVAVTVTPTAVKDGGHLVTVSTPQMFTSLAFAGEVLADVHQRVQLVVMVDRHNTCCEEDAKALVGPYLASLFEPPE